MTIDDAIESQRELVELLPKVFLSRFIASTNLSIEALKAIKRERQGDPLLDGELLPRETEENG